MVETSQRQRLLAAVAVEVVERGYADLTILDLTRGAGLSRRTFYDHFADKEEALLGAYDAIFARLVAAIQSACGRESHWTAKVAAAVSAAVRFAAVEPEATRLLTVDAVAAFPAATELEPELVEFALIPYRGRPSSRPRGASR